MMRAVILVGVFALAATGCAKKDDDTGSKSNGKPRSITVKSVEKGSGKYAFEGMPASMKAGVVTVVQMNAGKEKHEIQFIRLAEGGSLDALKKLFASDEDGAPIPAWLKDGGGPGVAAGGSSNSATMRFAPGTWAYICLQSPDEPEDAPDHWEGGMIGTVEVTGEAQGSLPATDATITAADYSFTGTGLKGGENTITFENTGTQLHHAIIAPIASGKTIADVKAFFASQGEPSGPPPVDFDAAKSTTVIDGGVKQVITLDLKPGKYAFACFLNDRAGGPPHVAKGMISEVTVA